MFVGFESISLFSVLSYTLYLVLVCLDDFVFVWVLGIVIWFDCLVGCISVLVMLIGWFNDLLL